MLSKIFYHGMALVLCCSFLACNRSGTNHKNSNTRLKSATTVIPNTQLSSSKNIADNISSDTALSIFAEALRITGLSDMLSKPGPFTVFVSMNPAFRKLPDGTLEGLMKERKNDLANILSHHIVAGVLREKDLEASQKLETVAGEGLLVTNRNNETMINGVKINTPGFHASNGMIYVITDLLFPKNQNPGAY